MGRVRHRHRGIVLAPLCFALSACAINTASDVGVDEAASDTGADEALTAEPSATTEEAADNAAEPTAVVSLVPWNGDFHDVWSHLATRKFAVPRLSAIHVGITTTWNRPTCGSERRLVVALRRENGAPVGADKVYPTGRAWTASWPNLDAGVYYLEFAVRPPFGDCMLRGTISVGL